ncbi:hypothetical protein M1740_20910 [Salmonella enterica subsp. enterica serovar Montevideo]|uniref:hypothetical protein n=1 Tax=Salmonella enterica TaxID=28901 RepID=UPI001273E483|nr:hypothetical protein [Salmonella enterica]EBM9948214.1 hypothetical protein [Salmonella enterica subsp. enterica serovar Give]ECD0158005.1 hypothetical protein [Salmonella enterica subsp. enterica]ECX3453446.1 hypothetical protein [Salmonella enterica subsp. enterica serovar Rubislaw]EDX7330588.1 hypothetical protein [Salmonella enterica subsp. enterica serovar Florida]EBE4178358.1 hypothetical protein [Salmonella enterica]
MRVLKYGALMCVCLLIVLMGYLAMRSIQLEGASLKTCVLISAPFLIWLAYQKACLFVQKFTTGRKTS